MLATKKEKRISRHKRVRSKIIGTQEKPRLAVFRSNKYIYAQLIDDEKGNTIAAVNSKDLKDSKGTLKEQAKKVGSAIAESAKKEKIESVVFDRGGFEYAGAIKELAEGAREGGLKF